MLWKVKNHQNVNHEYKADIQKRQQTYTEIKIETSVSFVLVPLYLQKYVKSRKMLKADNKLGKKKICTVCKYNTHQ